MEVRPGPGHPRRKPTCILSNQDSPDSLHGLCGRSAVQKRRWKSRLVALGLQLGRRGSRAKDIIKDVLNKSLGCRKAYAVL